jgi:hypothetical protein
MTLTPELCWHGKLSNNEEFRKYSKTSVHRWKTEKDENSTQKSKQFFMESTSGIKS